MNWCKNWCQWISSIPKAINPTNNQSNNIIIHKQNFPGVIFLCQTFESVPTKPHRTITIPKDVCIFMPIINWISIQERKEETSNYLKMLAKEMMDEVANLNLLINGYPISINLRNFRFHSPIFKMSVPDDNIFGVKSGTKTIVTDGFWIFFQPLVNDLIIETYGACRSGRTQIAVNYHIYR